MNEIKPLSVIDYSFQYQIRETLALKKLNFEIEKGEILLIAGSSGCGKTTLMRSINGLIPYSYRGNAQGDIQLFGKSVFDMKMVEISQIVGTVLQDPERQIVASFVFNEIAFGLENLGLPKEEILDRIDSIMRYLKISHLKDRETFQLSGGEKQKVVLAGVLAMNPKILLLDEPLASLDPASAVESLQVIRKLADDGISVIIVEHRVEDVLQIKPEKVMYLDEGEITYLGAAKGLLNVVDYSKIKLPAEVIIERSKETKKAFTFPALMSEKNDDKPVIRFEDVSFRYKNDLPDVLKGINFTINQNDIIAILGHNGAGKTTLVKHALGLLKPTEGTVYMDDVSTKQLSVAKSAHTIGYVFQSPSQMLFAPTVEEELSFGPKNIGQPKEEIKENVNWAIRTVNLEPELKTPPLALSFGQQKRVSIASILAMKSRVLMMDEPTAGQDYWNYQSFMDSIMEMKAFDAMLFITHDVDLAVIYANRVLLIYDGRIIADGSPYEVLKDEDRLRQCRIVPTSLLRLNLEHHPHTKQFMRAEALASVLNQDVQ